MPDIIFSPPNTEALSTTVVELQSYLQLNVNSLDSLAKAKIGLDAVAAQRPLIVALFRDAKVKAKAALDSITALEDSFLDPLTSIDKHLRSSAKKFLDDQQRAVEALQKKIEQARQEEEDELDPWERGTGDSHVQPVLMPRVPSVKGLNPRKLPARGVVKDKAALIRAAAAGLAGNEKNAPDASWLLYLDANETNLSARARQLGKIEFERRYPGCEYTQGSTIARR